MYLFFDTETTGLPRDWNAPITDTANWPRMVQLAWMLYESDGRLVESDNHIIYPEGFTIPGDAAAVHGISTKRALDEGEPLSTVLDVFDALVADAGLLVAHNISFDERIVGAEFIRAGRKNTLAGKPTVCTMERSTDYCRLPSRYGYKWPKLAELHYKLFHSHFEEAHNAAVDIAITAKCFWELRRLGVID